MRFANPEAFALLPLVLMVVWRSLGNRHHGAVRFSTLGLLGSTTGAWALFGPPMLALLRGTALALLILALARPQTPAAQRRSPTEGIAVQLVIDNSYSMRNRDYQMGSLAVSRLEAVKHAVRLFVAGGDHGLSGRPNDRIGMITFARDPDVVCPLTLDHKAVLDALDRIRLAPPVGTNIGDALAWSLDRLRHEPTRQKVIILLSDGSHNVKEGLPPMEASRLAADLHIKVYTIGAVGNRFGRPKTLTEAMQEQRGGGLPGDSVDEPMMEAIARQTGGRYFRATNTEGLADVYREIDRLETTPIERTVRISYEEWYLALLLPGLGLLIVEQTLAATRLLRIP